MDSEAKKPGSKVKQALHNYLEDHFKTFAGKVGYFKKKGYSDESARRIVGDAIYHGGGAPK